MKIVIITALKDEQPIIKNPQNEISYYICGIGKTNAAKTITSILLNEHPDLILNIGTAGALEGDIGDIKVCSQFVDRDMEKIKEYGVDYQIDTIDLVKHCSLYEILKPNSICNTGDTFVTEKISSGDVFDMEAFTLATICNDHSIPFLSIKCVSDIIGDNSMQLWEEKLSKCLVSTQHYLDQISL